MIRFLLDRGFPIPSPAVLGKIGRDYVNQINAFIAGATRSRSVRFVKGDVQGGDRPRALPAGRAGGPLRRRDGRGRAGEDLGVARVARRRAATGTRTSSIAASRSSRTTTTSTSATRTGGRRSSRPSRTRRSRSGSTSTGTSGPNSRPPSRASTSGRWITGSLSCEDAAGARRDLPTACPLRMCARSSTRWQARCPSPFTAEDRARGYALRARVPAARDLRHPRLRPARRGPRLV